MVEPKPLQLPREQRLLDRLSPVPVLSTAVAAVASPQPLSARAELVAAGRIVVPSGSESRKKELYTSPRRAAPLPSGELSKDSGAGLYEEALAQVRRRHARPIVATAASRPGELLGVQPRYLSNTCVMRGSTLPLKTGAVSLRKAMDAAQKAQAIKKAVAATQGALAALDISVIIAEALTTIELSTSDGLCKAPPSTWLVFDPEDWRHRTASGDPAPLRLAAGTGGGVVAAAAVPRLQRVSGERLHAKGVEANFQRAARGASLCALQHAAVLLQMHGQRPLPPQGERAPAAEDVELRLSPTEVAARVQRAEDLVSFRASAASQVAASRRSSPSPRVSPRRSSKLSSLCDGSSAVMAGSDVGRHSVMQRGFQAWQEFQSFAIRRFGNPVRLWFAMDPEENMKIGEMQFARACEEMGYRGNVAALWRYLDRDGTQHVTLKEVDAASSVLLAEFKFLISQVFGGSVTRTVEVLDANRSNRIFKAEFVAALRELGYQGPAKRLFDLLARQSLGFMAPSDLAFLEKWDPPPYLFSKPDAEGLRHFQEALLSVHANTLQVWVKSLDRDKNMRVSWQEFRSTCSRLHLVTPKVQNTLKKDAQIAAIWRALDMECSGWVSLREYDRRSFDVLSQFKRWLDQACGGSAAQALRTSTKMAKDDDIDDIGAKPVPNGGTTRHAMKHMLHKSGFSKEAASILCDGLDVKDCGVLTEADLKFLEKWDLAWEDWLASSGMPA